MKLLGILLILFCFISCSSLSEQEINELSHCPQKLKKVRRNLLRMGAKLTADEKDFIRTDYKRLPFGFSFPTAFMIDKVDKKSVKIQTMIKTDPDSSGGPAAFNSATKHAHLQVLDRVCYNRKARKKPSPYSN